MNFLCDGYQYETPESFAAELRNSLGFAIQFQGDGVGDWLEVEEGIVHFVDPRVSGAKRRIRIRVSIEEKRIRDVQLANNWLEPVSSSDRDPRRTFMMNTQTIQDPLNDDVTWAQGKASEALLQLLQRQHEKSLWNAIGFSEIPMPAQINFFGMDIPF